MRLGRPVRVVGQSAPDVFVTGSAFAGSPAYSPSVLTRSHRLLLLFTIAALLGGACSGGDDDANQAFVNSERSPETVDELLSQDAASSDSAALEEASDGLAAGPTPIGPNTRAILAGPPFEKLSSVATGCVLTRQGEDQQLLDLFTAAVSEQRLALADVVTLRAAAVDCAAEEVAGYFATMASDRAATITPEGAVGCTAELLRSDLTAAERPFLTGVTAIDLDQAVPPQAVDVTIDGLASCFDGISVGPAIRAQLTDQPVLANAADSTCIDQALATDGASSGFWSRLVRGSGMEPGAISAEVAGAAWTPLERCVSSGRVIAGISANYGVSLSANTVGCLDQASSDRTLVTRTIAGDEPDPAEFMTMLSECATEQELSVLQQ